MSSAGKQNARRLAKRADEERRKARDEVAENRLKGLSRKLRKARTTEIRAELRPNRAASRDMARTMLPRRARAIRKRSRTELTARPTTHQERRAKKAAESAARLERRTARREAQREDA